MKPGADKSSQKIRASSAIMDVEDALHRLDEDEDLFRDIVQIYLEDAPHMLQSIHDAVSGADARALQRAAHGLKGLTATLSAQSASGAAYRLEQMGATGNLAEVNAALAQIDERIDELNHAAHDYLHGPA
jgi:HPt (histidine-containing phosphotransfer) domain-containing protein